MRRGQHRSSSRPQTCGNRWRRTMWARFPPADGRAENSLRAAPIAGCSVPARALRIEKRIVSETVTRLQPRGAQERPALSVRSMRRAIPADLPNRQTPHRRAPDPQAWVRRERTRSVARLLRQKIAEDSGRSRRRPAARQSRGETNSSARGSSGGYWNRTAPSTSMGQRGGSYSGANGGSRPQLDMHQPIVRGPSYGGYSRGAYGNYGGYRGATPNYGGSRAPSYGGSRAPSYGGGSRAPSGGGSRSSGGGGGHVSSGGWRPFRRWRWRTLRRWSSLSDKLL